MREKACDALQDNLAELVKKALKDGATKEDVATILILTAQDVRE